MMKTKTSLLILGLASTGASLSPALAQDDPDSASPAPIVPEAIVSEPVYNELEVGIGLVSDDAYKFGRYTGIETNDFFIIGAIDAEDYSEDGDFLKFHATDLGLESRYFRATAGVQGSYMVFIEYDELPNYKDNTVVSPFDGIGTNNLTLPPSFLDIDFDLYYNLHSFELSTKRERVAAGISFIPEKRWQFDLDVSHENKKGIDATGSAMANGSTQVLGNTTIALLPEPINFNTDMVNATLSYNGEQGQIDIRYHMSLFTGKDDYLKWEDPFNPDVAYGSMALAPDNEFHQLSVTGVYALPYNSRISALLSMGRMMQDQSFQPYTVNTSLAVAGLPRDSLEGEAWLNTVQLKLISRPIAALRLNAEWRYNERKNQTPIDTFSYVVMDSYVSGSVNNNPYNYKKNNINLNANYRFNAITSLRLGYKFEDMKRIYVDAERETTEEDTIFAKWKIKPHSTVDLALYAEAASRDGSEYNTLPGENPGLRKFHLADRERLKLGARVDYMATDKLHLGLRADFNRDDYNDTSIGLVEAIQPAYTVDFSYQPTHNISTYGYYTYERIESSQAGYDVTTSITSDWSADFDDIFNTAGFGARLDNLGKWDVGLDLVYSQSTGNIVLTDYQQAGTEAQFPDNTTNLASASLWADYNYDKELTFRLGLRYEDYKVENWAIDGIDPYDPATVANSLLLGNSALDYSTYVTTISLNYKFK